MLRAVSWSSILERFRQPKGNSMPVSTSSSVLSPAPLATFRHLPDSAAAAAAAKSLQLCPTLRDPIDSSPMLPHPWDSPGKNTGVGCHCLLQHMKVKSESEVAQSCPTLSDLMDCSLPGSSTHGIFQARVLEWAAIAFSILTLRSCLFWTPHFGLASFT